MAQTIKIKNGSEESSPASLVQGEFAVNVSSGSLWYGSGSSNVTKSSFHFSELTCSAVLDSNGAYVGSGNAKVAGTLSASYATFGGTAITINTNRIIKGTDAGTGVYNFQDGGVSVNGSITSSGDITASGSVTASGTISGSSDLAIHGAIYAANIGTGVDNSVVVLDSDGTLKTDEIDGQVWGGSGALLATDSANEQLAGVNLSEVSVGTAVTATTATNVNAVATTDTTDFFVGIMDGASGAQVVESSANLKYNPSTKGLTVGGSGSFTGIVSASGDITNKGDIVTDGFVNVVAGGQGYKLGSVKALWVNGTKDQVGRESTVTKITGSQIELGGTGNVHVTASGNMLLTGSVSSSGLEVTGNVTASQTVTAANYIGTKHLLYSGVIYINANPFTQNAVYMGNNYSNQDSNWNTAQASGGTLGSVSTISIAEDNFRWGMILPFDVSAVELQVSCRPGGACTGDNFFLGLYGANRPNNDASANLDITLLAHQDASFVQGKFVTNDFTHTANLSKGYMIFIGIGSEDSTAAKNAPALINCIITQR
tara:strand:- start:596 stop:2221 length:1626 start_codon:yes stop_codon:yes gene_type:complete